MTWSERWRFIWTGERAPKAPLDLSPDALEAWAEDLRIRRAVMRCRREAGMNCTREVRDRFWRWQRLVAEHCPAVVLREEDGEL